MYWTTGSGNIALQLTRKEARMGAHSGDCEADVKALAKKPRIARQLKELDPDLVSQELKEYGAWDEEERKDHAQNLIRLLWIACGDIADGNN